MANTKARRHYRTALKQAEYQHNRGVFVPNNKRVKFVALAVTTVVMMFLQGLLLGVLIGRGRR